MRYDLLVKGGRVIDPAAGMDTIATIGVSNGRIAAVGPDLATADAWQTIDADGRIVAPGLIDFHAHALFLCGIGLGAKLDDVCGRSGVTTFVDAGSAGAAAFPVLQESLIDTAATRVLVFLHISTIGLADLDVGEATYLDLLQPGRAAAMAQAHPELIVGIKVRQEAAIVGTNGLEPLRRAKEAAAKAGGLATMVHVTDLPVPCRRSLRCSIRVIS